MVQSGHKSVSLLQFVIALSTMLNNVNYAYRVQEARCLPLRIDSLKLDTEEPTGREEEEGSHWTKDLGREAKPWMSTHDWAGP